MKTYKEIKIQCLKYIEMLEIYERKYKQKYQLIGYSHNSMIGVGVLVLCERGNNK